MRRWTLSDGAAVILAGLAFAVFSFSTAVAQPRPQKNLEFPVEARELPKTIQSEMALYKPAGVGPFPALVLYPSAAGMTPEMASWAGAAVHRGYMVLLIDYMKQRGLTPKDIASAQVVYTQGARDSLQALAMLSAHPLVRPGRIGIFGFSWGAMAGLLAGSSGFRAVGGVERSFAAIVAFYPGCYYPPNKYGNERLLLRPDHDVPTLILQGGRDNEGTPEDCANRVAALKADARPIDIYTYPEGHHAWDVKSMDGFRKTDLYGHTAIYRYDSAITEDSSRRMFEFFDARLKAP